MRMFKGSEGVKAMQNQITAIVRWAVRIRDNRWAQAAEAFSA
jgi:hypothetical protein